MLHATTSHTCSDDALAEEAFMHELTEIHESYMEDELEILSKMSTVTGIVSLLDLRQHVAQEARSSQFAILERFFNGHALGNEEQHPLATMPHESSSSSNWDLPKAAILTGVLGQ